MSWSLLPILLAILCTQLHGMKITSLVMPTAVVNSSGSVVLDCQYTVEMQDSGLVVKWFFNNRRRPVYQWIVGKQPQAFGVLRGRLQLDYRATAENATMHRALCILQPTTELTGDYRCAVSTFDDEDFSKTQKMVVYAPEKSLTMTYTKPMSDSVNVTCQAHGLYPEPRIALFMEPFTHEVSQPLQEVTIEVSNRTGHYDISATILMRELTLRNSSTVVCEVCIPSTDYCHTKRLVYYPDDTPSDA